MENVLKEFVSNFIHTYIEVLIEGKIHIEL